MTGYLIFSFGNYYFGWAGLVSFYWSVVLAESYIAGSQVGRRSVVAENGARPRCQNAVRQGRMRGSVQMKIILRTRQSAIELMI